MKNDSESNVTMIIVTIIAFILSNMFSGWILQIIMSWIFNFELSYWTCVLGSIVADFVLTVANSFNKSNDK